MSYSLLPDYHVHTCFSSDSETPVMDIMKKADAMGLSELCITDHMDFDFPGEDGIFLFDAVSYFKCLRKIQESTKDMPVLKIGVELGIQPHLGNKLRDFTSKYPFDFIIGSSHVADGLDPFNEDFWAGRSAKEAVCRYFESTLENIQSFKDFDVYGHLDYVVRYCRDKEFSYRCSDYLDLTDACLKALIESGKGIEVNTAGLHYGLLHPNPHIDIIKRYRELGGEIITVGSDCHTAGRLADRFENLPSILKGCGFSYYTTFSERKVRYHKL